MSEDIKERKKRQTGKSSFKDEEIKRKEKRTFPTADWPQLLQVSQCLGSIKR